MLVYSRKLYKVAFYYDLFSLNKLASLKDRLVRNYNRLSDQLTGMKCRATNVAIDANIEENLPPLLLNALVNVAK